VATLLETQIRGGSFYPNRNIDITIDVTADISAYRYRAVTFDPGTYGITPISSTSDFNLIGVLQNATIYGRAIIRLVGVTRMIYGETISAYDMVQPSIVSGKEGRALVWSPSKDGHTHGSTPAEVVHTFFVTDYTGVAITGSTNSHFVKTLQSYSGGAFTTSGDVVTVTEASGGEYLAKYTPTVSGSMYRLMVAGAGSTPADGAIITPGEFQEVPYATPGKPGNSGCRFVLGQALEDGDEDDEGLVILRPQIF
jgi:hypothetical protein